MLTRQTSAEVTNILVRAVDRSIEQGLCVTCGIKLFAATHEIEYDRVEDLYVQAKRKEEE